MAIDATTEQSIKASVANGLTKTSIEALIGRTLNAEESQLYVKLRAIYQLQLQKKRKERRYEHLSGNEAVRKSRDKACSIDDELNQALSEIDWERRNEAEKSLSAWVKTYMCEGLALRSEPPPHGYEILQEMETALQSHKNYMICMGRGFGKSSYCVAATLFAIATGIHKYVVIIANNASQAAERMNDIWRVLEVPDSKFAHDYPEVVLPFTIAHGGFRRRQLYNGRSTSIQKNAGTIIFASLYKKDGTSFKTSGSLVTCRGITSGIRGMKHGVLRPTLVLLDDLQDIESASNPTQVQKIMDIINKDVMPLAGEERLSVLQTATPIVSDDLVQKIKENKAWKTSVYPAIIQYPTNMKLWDKYFNLYNTELVELRPHDESLQFYKDNFEAMNEGSQVFNPNRFSKVDGHISAIQKLLEMKNEIGEGAFESEYQMNPQQLEFALPITPTIIQSRKSILKELEIPSENVQFVVASSDLNLSKYITTTIVVFLNNQTATVIYHKFRKCKVPINIPEQEYYNKVYDLLSKHGKELKALGIRIDAWAIDANGVPAKAVQDFSKNSYQICGIPAAGFIGRASHSYRSYLKSRLKEDVNRTLLCGDDDEHKQAGSGRRWTFFDSDYYHEKVQKGFLQEIGNIGSITWYNGNDHTQWSIQVCAEKLLAKRQRQDGTFEYTWKDNGDHDALDSIGQALAAYGSQGFSTGDTGRMSLSKSRQKFHKRRIKIV